VVYTTNAGPEDETTNDNVSNPPSSFVARPSPADENTLVDDASTRISSFVLRQ
jgi:hypothetical protein